ncbi:MAG: hypothetical protein HY701_05310 [Gemmatimonadetes bacterium]|nr:hypothetical protein [Gemmatimonadota bacterium]
MIGLWSAVLALPLTVQLQQAAVEVTIAGTEARVQAVYTFAPAGAPTLTDPEARGAARDSDPGSAALLQLSAIRYPDATVEVENASATAGRIVATPLAGLQRLEVLDAPSGLSDLRVELRYRLAGNLSRIPLFVPSIPSGAAGTRIEIRIHGVDPDVPVQAGFPRLAWESPGVLLARPEHVPAFIQLPPARQRITATGLVDAAIILLIVLSSLYWVRWRRAAQPRHSATAAAAE